MKFPVIMESTRQFLREADNIPNYPLLEKVHGYIYLRWPYFYIKLGTGQHPWQKWLEPLANFATMLYPSKPVDDPDRVTWADSYHGKAMPLEDVIKLIRVDRDIEIRDLEKVLPYKRARDIVLQNPERIVLVDCPCRVARDNPCTPVDVCLIVGDPFASFALEHHPDKSRLIDVDEAVRILKEEDKRGHVHHAFFKEAMLGRFYAICNCCSCCCGAMQAQRNGNLMLCSSGYVAEIDKDECVNCGLCARRCQFEALAHANGETTFTPAKCMGCGVCVNACPKDAISLTRDVSRGEPLEIQKLMAEAM